MATYYLPKPGTDPNIYRGFTTPDDPTETRRIAESTCPLCGKAIGYHTQAFGDETGFVHRQCFSDAINEGARSAMRRY